MSDLRQRITGVEATARRFVPLPFQLLRTRWWLRRVASVGTWTRAVGRAPLIEAEGSIVIGRRGVVNSRYAPVALTSAPGASLTIGDRAVINFGTSLAAGEQVSLGHDVTIGPYCIVDDRVLGSPHGAELTDPITIGDGCWLASRVTVLPGTTIGDGSVIGAGSIVEGDIPAGVLFGGSPARVLKQLESPDLTESNE